MKEHIFSFANSQLTWLQFACRTGRGINYVKAFIIDTFTLDDQLILWTLDFLTGIIKRVRVKNRLSNVLTTSTGSPEGCVLSPLLFIRNTDEMQVQSIQLSPGEVC